MGLLAAVVLGGCAKDPVPSRQDLFNEGRARFWRGEYKGAIGPFREALTRDWSDPDTLYYLGNCYEHLGDLREARFYYNRAVTSFPGHGPSIGALERVEWKMNNPDAREFQPVTPPPPTGNRYEVSAESGGTSAAPSMVTPAAPVSDAGVTEINSRAPVYRPDPSPGAASPSSAARASSSAIQVSEPTVVDPQVDTRFQQAAALIDQARRAETQNDLDEALRLYQHATEVDATLPYPFAELGRYYMRIGQNDQAIEALKKAQSLNPNEPGVQADLAKLGA